MRVLITQTNYIPWKGYFDNIAQCDVFVIYDVVQYTRRDWRNRNKIKTPRGLEWLTIPVDVKGKYDQLINEARVKHRDWPQSHWGKIRQCYKDALHFETHGPKIKAMYDEVARIEKLTDINQYFLTELMALLGISTEIHHAENFELKDEPTERLVHICEQLGADEYWSGAAAKNYMKEELFEQAGIDLHYFDYSGYEEYQQLHGDFEHGVSILDLILMTGGDASKYLKYAK